MTILSPATVDKRNTSVDLCCGFSLGDLDKQTPAKYLTLTAMNADRGGGRGRGRGRNSGGNRGGNRGRGMPRSNSDGRSGSRDPSAGSPITSLPPGLHAATSQFVDNQYSSSLPTEQGWGPTEDTQQTQPSNRYRAAGEAAQRAPRVSHDRISHGGNGNRRGGNPYHYVQDQSPAQARENHGQNRHRNSQATDLHRNSGAGSMGRSPVGRPTVQSNIVPIPSRYLNSNAQAKTPRNGQQAAGSYESPNVRSNGNTPTGQDLAAGQCIAQLITNLMYEPILCTRPAVRRDYIS